MDLAFQESLPVTQVIILRVTSRYFQHKAIGNREGAYKFGEALRALHVYVAILEYYYNQTDNSELPITAEDIKEVYNKFKQVYFSVKHSPYGNQL